MRCVSLLRRFRREDAGDVSFAFEARRFPRLVDGAGVLAELDVRSPWRREDARVVTRHVVVDAVAGEGEALLDAQVRAMEVAVGVVPGVVVEVAPFDDERIAVP